MSKDNIDNSPLIFELEEYKTPEIKEYKNEDWVGYGEDNDHYNWLIERSRRSTTNGAIINMVGRLIVGRGLFAKDANKKPSSYAVMKSLISNNDLKKVALELKMLGAGHLQIHYNKQHTKIEKIYHIPTNLIRPEKCNKDGDIEGYYYSDDWDDIKKYPPKRYSAFGTSKDRVEIYCIKPYSVGMKYFGEVDYKSSIPYAILEEEISDFLINTVQNSFSGTKVVNFNNGIPDAEQRRRIANETRRKLTGSKGQKLIVGFNKNAESKTTVDDFPLDDAPEHYRYLSEEAQQKILIGHCVTSPMLVGVVTNNQGFSSNADEIEVAGRFFYNTAIKPFQDLIIDALDEILAFNNISLDLFFKRLDLLEEIEKKEQNEEQIASSNFSFSSDEEAQIFDIVNEYGEDVDENWELIDEREVDYDNEEELDAQLAEYEAKLKEPSTLKKIWNFVSTGTARGNAKSSQDGEASGFFFKVRYRYVGNPTPERAFCKAMMRANKIYRKEDIQMMGNRIVNQGFGFKGADTYDIWLYKGGPRCHHKWQRETYVSVDGNVDVKSPLATTVSTTKARQFGYRVTNEKEVSMKPNDMPHKGFHPANNNKPKDAR